MSHGRYYIHFLPTACANQAICGIEIIMAPEAVRWGQEIIAKWYRSFRLVSVGVLEPPVG